MSPTKFYNRLKPMKTKTVFKYMGGVCITIMGIYIYLILFPQVLFSNKISYRNFKIYSNNKIDDKIYKIIDNSIVQLKTCEIYDSTVLQKVFFMEGSFYFTLTRAFSKERAGFHEFLVNNTMVVPKVDEKNNALIYHDGKVCNLAQTIIHETVHSLQESKLGFWRVMKIPEWKMEGYAFYIAKTDLILNNGHLSNKYVRDNIEDLIKHPSSSKHYWMDAVMTGYLLNERHLNFEQFMADDVKEDSTAKEIVDWYFNNSVTHEELISMK